MTFEYVHKSLLSDAIFHRKNDMALHMLKSLMKQQHHSYYDNRLIYALMNSLVLDNENFSELVLPLVQAQILNKGKKLINCMVYAAIISLLLVKNNKKSLIDKFEQLVSINNILCACKATNAPMGPDTLHSYVLNKLLFP